MIAGRCIVVGGGIVGLATARRMQADNPGCEVVVLEKETDVGRHQTGHNSGVVHAGLYYQPGSLKAELCTRGRRLLQHYCTDHDLPYIECGKLVVARDDTELAALAAIEARATANGVPGLRRLDRTGLRAVEPHAAGIAALHSPHTAITDFAAIARTMAASLDVRLSTTVLGVDARSHGVRLTTADDTFEADLVVLCAGLHSDALARTAGADGSTRIVPFRGEYWRLRPERTDLVRGLIYPVPDPRYPFLGVHLTRRVDGGVDLGPNAVLGLSREPYRRTDIDPRWLAAAVRDPALWRMARAHWRTGLHEMAGSLSKHAFVARAAALLPGLSAADVVRAPAGVRAQPSDRPARCSTTSASAASDRPGRSWRCSTHRRPRPLRAWPWPSTFATRYLNRRGFQWPGISRPTVTIRTCSTGLTPLWPRRSSRST